VEPHLAIHLLVLLSFSGFLLGAIVCHIFVVIDALGVVFLHVQVHLCQLRLHGHLFLKALLLSSEHVHIAATLSNDLTGSLSGLVNFTNSLAFFLLEQPNSIAEQFQIFFGSLSSHLGGHELSVKSSIIIFFVGSQIKFIKLLLLLSVWTHRLIITCHV